MDIISKFINRNDIKGIEREVNRTNRRWLFAMGVKGQRLIRGNLKRGRNRSASPGASPFHHARGNNGLRFVRFIVEMTILTVVVGSVLFSGKKNADRPIPELQEGGGRVRGRGIFRRWFRVRSHPYVAPAGRELRNQSARVYAEIFSYRGK